MRNLLSYVKEFLFSIGGVHDAGLLGLTELEIISAIVKSFEGTSRIYSPRRTFRTVCSLPRLLDIGSGELSSRNFRSSANYKVCLDQLERETPLREFLFRTAKTNSPFNMLLPQIRFFRRTDSAQL